MPRILPAVATIWRGFWRLNESRQVLVAGGGMAPAVVEHRGIPYSLVEEWLDRNGFDGPERWWADHLLTFMDGFYRQYQREQGQQASEGSADRRDDV